ncbi:family 47 glycoside hydrolase [Melampsora larici-populina 98AG31]|uniref:alpha-1,2-Mannosidase n=1 Tax=Melampsora larici-populina (strain 98AG31 / pathotype 3-4-7) TaxID=747676 RepID=F4S146_MELLP|nr:family 47 glycoside hydrolase [Melampsora larici-populina 98AG31]EGG01508.1 family 47 glycoside hydrolase [Melampsora larici-populina 98AG31]
MNSKKSDSNSLAFQSDYQKKLNKLTSIQSSLLPFFKSRIRFIISFIILTILITTTLYLSNQPQFPTKFKFKSNQEKTIPTKPLLPPKKLNPSDYPDDLLLSLPILISTSNQPFNPINEHKPLPNHLTPFSTQTLYNKLKSAPTSQPPQKIPFPSHISSTTNRPQKVINTTIKAFSTSTRSKLPPSTNAKASKPIQYLGFKSSKFIKSWESNQDSTVRNTRKEWVKNAFLVVWEGYKSKAWAHDELKPISGSFDDPFSGWGATLVDCLDTLLIMDLPTEYEYARDHVASIDWSVTLDLRTLKSTKSPPRSYPSVPFFETVIRYLGGLISAYDLSNDPLMLKRAEDLADWLLPSFGTDLGFPLPHYQIGSNPNGQSVGRVCLAEMGSLLLEFTRLSQITQKPHYFYYVQRITDHLDSNQWNSEHRIGSLFPTWIDPNHPTSLYGDYTFGGMADSYYEYLIKQYQLLGLQSTQYSKMYTSILSSAKSNLIKTFELEPANQTQSNLSPKTITILGDKLGGKDAKLVNSLDHLTCFSGAMIGLGARLLDNKEDLDLAVSYTDSCVWAYESTKTGLGPERMSVLDDEKSSKYWEAVEYEGQVYRRLSKENGPPASVLHDSRYLGRPETIESVFYMWRITGDKVWQDRGWRMFTSWVEGCLTDFGFADLMDVNRLPYQRSDKQESFVLAETLKYYYLLFDDPNLISLDEYVFNTEAHPFKLRKDRKALRNYHLKEFKDQEIGNGSPLQLWAGLRYDELDEGQKEMYRKVIGI